MTTKISWLILLVGAPAFIASFLFAIIVWIPAVVGWKLAHEIAEWLAD